jgi:iron complex outermembrane receptor protein
MTAVGIPLSYASQIAAGIATTAATVPLGTVATDQQSDSDILMTFRQNTTDDIDFYGADFGFEFHATDRVTLNGSYSHVSEECFDFDGEAGCAGRDIALNAPTDKGSFGVSYDNKVVGTFISGRVRVSGAFPMSSGVYRGLVDGYQVLDLNMGYRVPGYTGFIVSLTLNNALNNLHQEFIGAPSMGRVGMVKLQYSF